MRARFSLRVLLLLIALALAISSHVVLAIRYAAILRERDELQARLGAIQLQDNERLHMRKMDTGATYHRKWKLFVPEGKTYAVFLAVQKIPSTGKAANRPHRLYEVPGTGKEVTISLVLQERQTTGNIETLVRTTLPTSVEEATLQLGKEYMFLVVPNDVNGFCEGDERLGEEATVVEDANHLIELVRLRKCSTNPAVSTTYPDPKPCDGVLLWLEEVPPKPPGGKNS